MKIEDLSPEETIDAALERLEYLIRATVERGEPAVNLANVAIAMFLPATRMLRYDAHMLKSCTSPEQLDRVEKASEKAGDLDLARAVLEAFPNMPQYTTKETN